MKQHDWKNSERVVNSEKNEIKLRQSDDLTMQVTVDHVANKIPFVCCNCSLKTHLILRDKRLSIPSNGAVDEIYYYQHLLRS